MRHLVRETHERGVPPRFDIPGAMVYCIDAFPDRVHNPRESEHLFRLRTMRADGIGLPDSHVGSGSVGDGAVRCAFGSELGRSYLGT